MAVSTMPSILYAVPELDSRTAVSVIRSLWLQAASGLDVSKLYTEAQQSRPGVIDEPSKAASRACAMHGCVSCCGNTFGERLEYQSARCGWLEPGQLHAVQNRACVVGCYKGEASLGRQRVQVDLIIDLRT